ncbi:MAG: hypothetical protein BWK79_03940 [Beggiatoa sp. IS2]|nr:MAG: hypothetical protein BWK79_03940 [Beggiatoa sp. IS2]
MDKLPIKLGILGVSLLLLLIPACSTVNDEGVINPSPVLDSTVHTPPVVSPVIPSAPVIPLPAKTPTPDSSGYHARGLATWYDGSVHGSRTANGEVYDLYGMTAAHATLPLGSRVRLRNSVTGQSVTVKITDRLTVTDNVLIKLSYNAASRLGLLQQAAPQVEIQGLPP